MGRLDGKLRQRLEEQNNRCPWCGGYLPLEYANPEHIMPVSMGGTDAYANLAAAHIACNKARSSNIWQEPVAGPQFEFIRERLKLMRDAEKSPDGLMILKRNAQNRKPSQE